MGNYLNKTGLTELWKRCKAVFLPLSGGKMTGTIDTATYKTEITVNTAKSTSDTPTIVAGGAIEASGAMIDKLTALRSFVGTYKNTANNSWYNVISTRHRNGYDDGDRRGIRTVAVIEVALGETRAAGELRGFARLQLALLGCGLAKRAVPVMGLAGPTARRNNRLGDIGHHTPSRMLRAK